MVVFTIACGGTGKAPAKATPAVHAGPEQAAVPLEPVAAPRELFAVARVRSLSKLADVGVRWTSLPFDWRSLVAKEMPGIERVIVFEAPTDCVATLDPMSLEPHVFWAFAFGVVSADAAATYFRNRGDAVTRRAGGVYAVGLEGLHCDIAPARGMAAARVVCSDEMTSVDALAPYMARGLPSEAFGNSDFHMHVISEPFRRRYSSELALIKTMGVPFLLRELELGHAKFDHALRDVMYGFADELIALANDADRLDIDASLTPREDAVLASMTFAMRGQESWTAQGIVRASAAGGAAPDFFWQLPQDSTAASYSLYSDPERIRGIAASLGDLLDGWLEYYDLPDSRRRPLVAAFEDVLTAGGRTAYAAMPEPAETRGAESDPKIAGARRLLGAHLFVVDHGNEGIQRFASELVKSLGDRKLRERVVKTKLLRADQMPAARERAPKGKKSLPPGSRTFQFEFPASAFSGDTAPAVLPQKSTTKAAHQPGTPKGAASSKIDVVLIVVPNGPYTWLAFGSDESALVDRLFEVLAGNGATLAMRDGLTDLRTEKAISAGFSSLASVVPSLTSGLAAGGESLGGPRVLGRLPHRGETPVLYRLLLDANGPKMTVSAVVPQAVVEDVVALSVSQMPRLVRPSTGF